MLILQNVTAVQLEPARVQSGVDIAIEGSLIKQVGAGLAARYPQAEVREMNMTSGLQALTRATVPGTPTERPPTTPS